MINVERSIVSNVADKSRLAKSCTFVTTTSTITFLHGIYYCTGFTLILPFLPSVSTSSTDEWNGAMVEPELEFDDIGVELAAKDGKSIAIVLLSNFMNIVYNFT